ncbi:hypothetical protein D3C71_1524340 [compost metagenome]
MDGHAEPLHAAHHYSQAQRIAVIYERVPVGADASLTGQAEWPLWVAAGARLDVDSSRPCCVDKQCSVSGDRFLVKFFGHDFVLAAIAADFEGGGVTGFGGGVQMYSCRAQAVACQCSSSEAMDSISANSFCCFRFRSS